MFLTQAVLFPLVASDQARSHQLQWMFWLEGPAIVVTGMLGALLGSTAHAGAGMLIGMASMMGITNAVLVWVVTMHRGA